MVTTVSASSRTRSAYACAPPSSLARTDSMAARMLPSRSCPTPLTRRARATASSSPLPLFAMALFRWRTTAAAARSTGTPPKSALTGSSSFASSTPAASTTTTRVATTTSRSAPTAWARARPSMPPSIWTSRFGATATSTPCTLRRARSSVPKRRRSRLSPATRTAPAPPSSGAPILRSLPRSAFPTTGIARPCAARPWSTPT